MFNKSFSTKQITILSFVISLLAIITSFAGYGDPEYIAWPRRLLRPFYFEFPNGGITLIGDSINIYHFQLLFAVLFFIGAIRFVASKQKQTRLLRFGFSLVFLVSSLNLLFSILNNLILHQIPHHDIWAVMSSFSFFVIDVLYFYISLCILNYFNKTTQLEVIEYDTESTPIAYLVPASKWKRAINKIIDVYIALLAFTPLIQGLMHFKKSRAFLHTLQDVFSEKISLYIFVIIYSIIYYVITESIIGTSPAKFITGTRVVNNDGQKPSFGQILRRTMLRIIPLESITFLVSTGWHDLYSGTIVAKEEEEVKVEAVI